MITCLRLAGLVKSIRRRGPTLRQLRHSITCLCSQESSRCTETWWTRTTFQLILPWIEGSRGTTMYMSDICKEPEKLNKWNKIRISRWSRKLISIHRQRGNKEWWSTHLRTKTSSNRFWRRGRGQTDLLLARRLLKSERIKSIVWEHMVDLRKRPSTWETATHSMGETGSSTRVCISHPNSSRLMDQGIDTKCRRLKTRIIQWPIKSEFWTTCREGSRADLKASGR